MRVLLIFFVSVFVSIPVCLPHSIYPLHGSVDSTPSQNTPSNLVYRKHSILNDGTPRRRSQTATFSILKPEGNRASRAITRKIALFIEPSPFTWVSGYANRYLEVLKFLRKNGDSVEIVTPACEHKGSSTANAVAPSFSLIDVWIMKLRLASAKAEFDNIMNATAVLPLTCYGFRITHVAGFALPLYNYKGYALSADLPQLRGLQLLKRFQPDLLHVTSPGFLAFTVALIYSKFVPIPLILSYHTHLPAYLHFYFYRIPGLVNSCWMLIRWLHNKADLTLVPSPQLKSELLYWGVRRVAVWRKGIDTERFHPAYRSASMRHRLSGGNPKDPLLLYVGRLGAEKNLDVLVTLMDRIPEARLAIVGSGPVEDYLKQQLNNNNRTIFLGTLTGKTLSEAFASADVFVMPSLTETLGFVVLESMASGVPCVAFEAGGVSDIVDHCRTGYLVPHNLHQQKRDCSNLLMVSRDSLINFEHRVRQLISSPVLRRAMGQAGRADAEKWSWESSVRDLRANKYELALANYKTRSQSFFEHSPCMPVIRILQRMFNFCEGTFYIILYYLVLSIGLPIFKAAPYMLPRLKRESKVDSGRSVLTAVEYWRERRPQR